MSPLSRVHVIVSGVVQGVGYRIFACSEARQRGLTGWVRNRSDGAVELVAEGEDGLVRELIKELKQGPISSDVSGVTITPTEATSEFDVFDIRS
jgi:acylphosphatase